MKKIGNPTARTYAVKLKCLDILAHHSKPILRRELMDYGWPGVARPDEHGLTYDEEILDRRRLRYRLDQDTSTSLRALRGLGLVASRRPEGWTAILWEITPEGRQWLRDDAAEFAQSVRETLDSIPEFV